MYCYVESFLPSCRPQVIWKKSTSLSFPRKQAGLVSCHHAPAKHALSKEEVTKKQFLLWTIMENDGGTSCRSLCLKELIDVLEHEIEARAHSGVRGNVIQINPGAARVWSTAVSLQA